MNIKNAFKSLAFAMLMPTMLFTTSCGNEDEVINGGDTAKQGYKIPVTVNVTRQGDKAGTRATYDGTTKKLSFSEGDKLLVDGFTDDVTFAGILEWVSGGTFSGLLDIDGTYSGTEAEMFTEASDGNHFIEAVLLPNGWETYGVLSIDGDGAFRYFYEFDYTKAIAPDLATAVEQFSLEQATTYSSGFALAPMNAIVNCSYKHSSTVAQGTVCKPYLSYGGMMDFGGEVEIPFGKNDIINFAIGVQEDDLGDTEYRIKDYSSNPIINVTLGGKQLLSGHIYNWKNYTLLSLTVTDPYNCAGGAKTIYYAAGETWGQAIANHPTENADWDWISNFPTVKGADDNVSVCYGDNDLVVDSDEIDAAKNYYFCD